VIDKILDIKNIIKETSSIIYGLLKEQYAIMFLKTHPQNIRKYCIHLLFSGHKYA